MGIILSPSSNVEDVSTMLYSYRTGASMRADAAAARRFRRRRTIDCVQVSHWRPDSSVHQFMIGIYARPSPPGRRWSCTATWVVRESAMAEIIQFTGRGDCNRSHRARRLVVNETRRTIHSLTHEAGAH